MSFQGSSDKAASIIVQGSPPGKSCRSESRVATPAAAEGWAHQTRKEAPWKETGPLCAPWDEIKSGDGGGVNTLPWGPFLFGFLHHVPFPVSASGSLDYVTGSMTLPSMDERQGPLPRHRHGTGGRAGFDPGCVLGSCSGLADLGGSPLQLNTCPAGGGRGHVGTPSGVEGSWVTEPLSSEDTGPALWDEVTEQAGKQEMGRGTGEEGMNWRLFHQGGGQGTTHTPDGPGSQVAELPSPESDRASLTPHFRVLSVPAVIGGIETCSRTGPGHLPLRRHG